MGLSGRERTRAGIWLGVYFSALVWSAVDPRDYFTWFLEALPAWIALGVLAATYRRFPLTPLAYALILFHCVVLMIGGHYTYAEVPLFGPVREWFGWERNNFDKIGHFAQGFVPAVIAREVLVRNAVVHGRAWLNLLAVALCLAFSALYEMIEWWTALAVGDAAESFLGTQGYAWDTQSDMALALAGAVLSIVLLSRRHDGQIRKLIGPSPRRESIG